MIIVYPMGKVFMILEHFDWVTRLSQPVNIPFDHFLLKQEPGEKEGLCPENTIKGIELPEEVIRQLRQALGTPVEWLSQGELVDAKIGFAADGIVFDDPNGDDFHDRITKTHAETLEEKAKEQRKLRVKPVKPMGDKDSFSRKIQDEREYDGDSQDVENTI